MENSELKLKYKVDFEIARKLVNEFDPCGFISGGFPIDEYDYLTNNLLSSIYNKIARPEIKNLILSELEHHFGTPNIETLDKNSNKALLNNIDKLIDKLEHQIKIKPNH